MGNDVRLLTTEKNAVLTFVREIGLDPSQFRWNTEEFQDSYEYGAIYCTISKLAHVSSTFYYKFGLYTDEFSPGYRDRVETADVSESQLMAAGISDSKWEKRLKALQIWLAALKEEVETPDLWASIGQEKALSAAAASATIDNRPFTAVELSLISGKLNEIKGNLLASQLFATDQAETIDSQFEYLREASRRMGRKDWLLILYGGLITLVVGLALAPEAAKSLLRLAATAFQSLWGGVQGYLR